MNPTPLEHDLLDLIEGRLPAERVGVVRAALENDPVLARRIERMVADRKAVAGLLNSDEQSAMAARVEALALVRSSMRRAATEVARPARSSAARHRYAAAAMVLLVAGAIIGAGWFIRQQNAPPALPQATVVPRGGQMAIAVPEEKADPTGLASKQGAASPGANEGVKSVGLPAWLSENPDPGAERSVASWSSEVETKLAQERDRDSASAEQLAAAALERVSNSSDRSLSIEEAAALALKRRVRLVIPAGARPSQLSTVQASSEFVELASAPDPKTGVMIGTGEVVAPLGGGVAAVQDGLFKLSRRFAGPDGPQPRFELVEESAEGPSTSVVPSTGLYDILWWRNQASSWSRSVSIMIDVRLEEPLDR